jgi:hypothetical protein
MSTREPEYYRVQRVEFLREQDGESEREFKDRVVDIFERWQLKCNAYLVQVRYPPDPGIHVALCIRGNDRANDKALCECGFVFTEMFNTEQQLDSLVISDEQEADARSNANPFYSTLNEQT